MPNILNISLLVMAFLTKSRCSRRSTSCGHFRRENYRKANEMFSVNLQPQNTPKTITERDICFLIGIGDNATRGPFASENKENAQGQPNFGLVFELTDKKGCYVPIVTILGCIRDSSSIFDRKGVTRATHGVEWRVAKGMQGKEWRKWLLHFAPVVAKYDWEHQSNFNC